MATKQIIWTTKLVEEAIEKIQDGYILKKIENPFFDNIVGLRRSGLVFKISDFEYEEYIKCALDIHYFAENYCFVKGEEGKPIKIQLRDYQKEILDNFANHRFNILMASRQVGKTISAAITMIHFILFNNNKNVLVTANKLDTVIEILDKIREIYTRLPFFLQKGVNNSNQKAFVLENKSRIKGFATTKTSSIGNTGDMLYLDEFAYIPDNIADKFYKSIFPTISNIENSKIIITSTPNGYNLFHKLLIDAERPEGDPQRINYKANRVYWWQVPKRFVTYVRLNKQSLDLFGFTKEEVFEFLKEKYTKSDIQMKFNDELKKDVIHILNEKGVCEEEDILKEEYKEIRFLQFAEITTWKKETMKDIGGEEAFNQEYDLRFTNSSKSLLNEQEVEKVIESKVEYTFEQILEMDNKLKWPYTDLKWINDDNIFLPLRRKEYRIVMSIDVGEGLGQDYHVVNIFKISPKDIQIMEMQKEKYTSIRDFFKLQQVGFFRNNIISIKQLAELVYLLAFEYFNDENVKIVLELNNHGGTLLEALPNVFEQNNNYGSSVFVRYKHRIDAIEEKIGLKVNDNKNLLVKGFQDAMYNKSVEITNIDNIHELTTFVKVMTPSGHITYKGESGNDDAVMSAIHAATVLEKNFFTEICEELLNIIDVQTSNYIKETMNRVEHREYSDYSSIININRQRRYNAQYRNR